MMKTLSLMLALSIMLLVVPITAAQEAGLAQPAPAGTLSRTTQVCPGARGSNEWRACAYPAPAADAAAKPAGLAQHAPAPAVDLEQGSQSWWFDREGYAQDRFSLRPAATAAKPAGLAQLGPAPAVNPEQGWQSWWFDREGYAEDSFSQLPAAAASKPTGLAQAAPVRSAVQGWPGCPYGYDHDPKCQSGPAAAPDTVSKPVGLAQLAPVVTDEKFVPCAVWMASSPEAAALLCTR